MRRISARTLVILVTLSPTLLLAHPDDPKIYDRQPPYDGPGYRRALRGEPPAFPAVGLTLQSWIPVTEFDPGFSAANDCWGYVSPSGREYAIIGLSGGTSFVEVTNPANAQIVATLAGPSSTWRDIKVYQDYAYAVSEGGSGIQVFDLTQIDSGTVTLANTVTTGGSTTATHNVVIDTVSGYLYRTGGGDEGLRIYDLSNPSTPVYVASWTDRYVHDAQVVTYTSGPYAGRQIAFCASGFNGGWTETGIDILDVTDKGNIFQVSRVFYSGPQYSHQLWLSPDRRYLYLDDELDEQNNGTPTTTRVLDVSDLEAPFEIATYTNGNTSIDHNLYTRGSMIFAANYRSGLRVFDATDQTAPVEVAFYDTYAADDNA
ncbi:MAG: choice-of-anchor B family protein, partial [Planctomycetota bacterium]